MSSATSTLLTWTPLAELRTMRQAILDAGVVTEEQNNFLRRLNTEIDAREELNSRLTERMVRP